MSRDKKKEKSKKKFWGKKPGKKKDVKSASKVKIKDKYRGGRKKNREEEPEKEYILKENDSYEEGIYVGHPKGFGFVVIEGREEDIFIPESASHGAIDTDKVQVLIYGDKTGKRCEGSIVKILERGISQIVGTYQRSNSFGFVISDNPKFSRDVFVPREYSQGAATGDKVIAGIVDYGTSNRNPEGKILEILGNEFAPGVDILAISRAYGIPDEFPEKAVKQASRMPEELLEGDFYGRKDIRDWTVVTIDGEDAKDLDDGISLTREGDIYHLGVHIADVTNYVQGGSALDKEALKRGTSVYLVDRVIPMLPQRLSNGICSLNQGADRVALSCLMDVDAKGKVIGHEIVETVIRVDQRMSYTDVKNILEESDEEAMETYKDYIPMFRDMEKLSGIIRKSRVKRGAIDFDFPECKIKLNSQGKPVSIEAYEQNVATRLIEDFMLLANETVAEEFCRMEIPFLYRSHEQPDPEKVEALLTMLHNQGLKVQKAREHITPKEIQKILGSIQGDPNEPLISRMTLRTMQQARYTTEPTGHFGLAAKYYCHFTSPIRRYPDLQIHRIIKDYLRGRMTPQKRNYYGEFLDEVAAQSSAMERRAEEAERETNKLKKAEYMLTHIGEEFEGVISGVTGWGLYVELPNTVEGLVHVNTLSDDFYNYDEGSRQLKGQVTGRCYTLGEKVRVRVMDVDTYKKTIDFMILSSDEA